MDPLPQFHFPNWPIYFSSEARFVPTLIYYIFRVLPLKANSAIQLLFTHKTPSPLPPSFKLSATNTHIHTHSHTGTQTQRHTKTLSHTHTHKLIQTYTHTHTIIQCFRLSLTLIVYLLLEGDETEFNLLLKKQIIIREIYSSRVRKYIAQRPDCN